MSHNTASCATRGFAFRRTTSEVRLNIPCFGVDPVTVCSLHRTKYRDAYSRDFLGRRWTQPPSLIGKQALEKSGNCMPEKNGSQTAVRRGFEPEVERPRSHLRSAALTGCSPGDLAAVCILTSLLGYKDVSSTKRCTNIMHRVRRNISMAAMISSSVQVCASLSHYGIVEICAALRAQAGRSSFGVPGSWVGT